MSSTPLKRISPIFQQVLNKQIAKIMDAIDSGNVELAYVCCKTLIDGLDPKDRNRLLEEIVNPVDEQLQKVGNGESTDYYTGLIKASKEEENILYKNIRNVFRHVMGTLHDGGYLQFTRAATPTNVPMSVFAPPTP